MKTGNSLIDDAVIIIPEHCENCNSGERSNHTGTNFDCETCNGTGRIEVGIPAITWLKYALKHFQVYAGEIKPREPLPPLTDEQRAGLQETRDYLTECIEDNERTNNDV